MGIKEDDISNNKDDLSDDEINPLESSIDMLDEFELRFNSSEKIDGDFFGTTSTDIDLSMFTGAEDILSNMTLAEPESTKSDTPIHIEPLESLEQEEQFELSEQSEQSEQIKLDVQLEQEITETEVPRSPFNELKTRFRVKKTKKASNLKVISAFGNPAIQKGIMAIATLTIIVSFILLTIVVIGLFRL